MSIMEMKAKGMIIHLRNDIQSGNIDSTQFVPRPTAPMKR